MTLFFADQVTVSLSDNSASLVASAAGLVLPIVPGKASISSSDRGDGSFEHVADLTLKVSGVDSATSRQLRQVSGRGCVLKAEDFDGYSWLLGDGDYPLSGTLEELHGTLPSDLHHWRLQLSAVCLHSMMRL